MPPLGTHKFVPIQPSGAAGDDAEYHRTFEKFTTDPLNMWPKFKANPRGWNYRGQEAFEKEFEDAYAKRVGAFYVHQRVGDRLHKVRVVWKDDQKFHTHATFWESMHSTLFPAARLAEPVVDDKLRIIGHLGWWWQDQIFIPKGGSGPDKDVQSLVASGEEIFAGLSNPLPSHYKPNDLGAPRWKFHLMTAPDGQVVGQFGYDVGAGAVSTIAPWELISIGRAAVTLAGVGSRQVIRLVVRKGRERVAAVGPTKAAAEVAAKRAASTPAAQITAQSGTIHSVSVGRFGTPGHLVARIELEQGKVVYRVASIHLKAQGSAAEIAARKAHREMMQRAAQEAQKRGQKEFTFRGIDAGENFRVHANALADKVGVAGSGKTFPGSASGYTSYEVTLETAKVLASKQAAARTASQAAAGVAGGRSAGYGGGQGAGYGAGQGAGRGAGRGAANAARAVGQRPVGRITPEEMEAYLRDVLAQRQDLRRLMAARTLTGDRLHQEVRAILKEWEFAHNWSVKYVPNGAVAAASRPGNLIWMNKAERTLMIDRQVAQNPQTFFDQVRHELVAHSLGGGHGTAVPFIQVAEKGQAFNAQVILEATVQRGDLGAVLRFFLGG